MTATKKTSHSGKDVVYVDHDDEITSVIDKVEASNQKIVALVLPKRFPTLQSIVNMRLLKRASERADKNAVLITSEAALLPLAGAAGLHVAKNLQSKPEIPPSPVTPSDSAKETPAETTESTDDGDAKLDHHRAIGELAAIKAIDETIDLEDEKPDTPAAKPPKDRKLKVPDFDRFRLLMIAGACLLVALIIFSIIGTRVLPKATVTINTTSDKVAADFNMNTSDKIDQVDEKNKTIPAELKKADQTATTTVNATGEQNNGDKAEGSVVITAKKCSGNPFDEPSDIPSGSGISGSGLVFITKETAEFSFSGGGGSCVNYSSDEVEIVAQEAGEKYNVDDKSFTVIGRTDVSATGSADGGSDDITKVLSQQDLDNAKQKITSEDSDKFSKKFQDDLKAQGLYVIQPTLKLSEPSVSADQKVGDEVDSAQATVKITYSAIAVPKADLEKILNSALKDQIDAKKQQLSDDDITSKATITVVNQGSGANATVNVSIESTAIPKLDQALIKQQIGGKKTGEIKEIITQWPGVKDVKVDMSPFWVSKAPKNAAKITIKLEPVSNDNQSANGE